MSIISIISDYGESEVAIPHDRNGDLEPKILEKRQTRTDEIEQKSWQCTQKDILGIWISENEGASFYASICCDLKKRGVTDIFIACHDNSSRVKKL